MPLEKLKPLADILETELAFLLPMWMEQYGGKDLCGEVTQMLCRTVTSDEARLVSRLREVTDGRKFSLTHDATLKISDAVVVH